MDPSTSHWTSTAVWCLLSTVNQMVWVCRVFKIHRGDCLRGGVLKTQAPALDSRNHILRHFYKSSGPLALGYIWGSTTTQHAC
jgi:hypothetical protein